MLRVTLTKLDAMAKPMEIFGAKGPGMMGLPPLNSSVRNDSPTVSFQLINLLPHTISPF
jgi:hypothetical protein